MAINLRDYDPALMQGANIGVSIDLTDIVDQNGNEVLEIDGTASAVNYVALQNSATGSAPLFDARGDDTNVGLNISSKGTGSVTLWTGAKAREGLIVVNTASAVNEITVTPAATGSAPALGATGDDTNIPLRLTPKGTGVVELGAASTGTIAAGAVTLNAVRGVITTGAAITAATTSGVYSFDFVNNKIWPTSILLLFLADQTGNGILGLGPVTLGSGSVTVRLINLDQDTAVSGSVKIHFVVLG